MYQHWEKQSLFGEFKQSDTEQWFLIDNPTEQRVTLSLDQFSNRLFPRGCKSKYQSFRPKLTLFDESGKGKPKARGRYMFRQGYSHIDFEKMAPGKYKLKLQNREKKSAIAKTGNYKLTTWGGNSEVHVEVTEK